MKRSETGNESTQGSDLHLIAILILLFTFCQVLLVLLF